MMALGKQLRQMAMEDWEPEIDLSEIDMDGLLDSLADNFDVEAFSETVAKTAEDALVKAGVVSVSVTEADEFPQLP